MKHYQQSFAPRGGGASIALTLVVMANPQGAENTRILAT